MTRIGVLAFGLVAASAALALAQPPDTADGRFTFHRADDGYLRLDGRTGQVSLCNRRPSGWQCQSLPDERMALEAEIGRLQGDNAALRKELKSRSPIASETTSDARPNSDDREARGKTSVDIRQIIGLAEAVWRRLAAFVAGVQREIQRWWI